MTLPFEPNRFQSAAPHYLTGRPASAKTLTARVAQLTNLHPSHHVLDLGCGPGQLAHAFAPYATAVTGLDPEPEMLAIARQSAPQNVQFHQASSYDLTPAFGTFHLVTIGRAFHWMDRADTLHRLDQMVTPTGAIALFSDKHPDLPENDWYKQYRQLLTTYGPETGRYGRRNPDFTPAQSILLASPFSTLELIAVIERRLVTAQSLIDRALSMSSTSRTKIGPRADDMVTELQTFLTATAPTGQLEEIVSTQALIARRQ